jgi:uroporphyrinogen-III decarboxylase
MALDFLPLHVPCGLSFASDWLHYNAGAHFDEPTMRDPLQRLAMETESGRTARLKFPQYFRIKPGAGQDYKAHPSLGIGVATVPFTLGSPVHYEVHMYPHALPLLKPDDNPMAYRIPPMEEAMQWLFAELDQFVEAGYDKGGIGFPDLQGPLNIAMRIVGDNRMLGLMARPSKAEVVRHILDQTSDAYIQVTQILRKATGKPAVSNWSVAGCSYYYISPAQWEQFILPIIHKCEVLGAVRLHHCGEANSDKIRVYAKYPWREVELGFGSDLALARKLFVHPKLGPVNISCRVSPYRMLNQSADQIAKDINWILENVQGGPASIHCVGVPLNTPDANISAFYDTIDRYMEAKEAALETDD